MSDLVLIFKFYLIYLSTKHTDILIDHHHNHNAFWKNELDNSRNYHHMQHHPRHLTQRLGRQITIRAYQNTRSKRYALLERNPCRIGTKRFVIYLYIGHPICHFNGWSFRCKKTGRFIKRWLQRTTISWPSIVQLLFVLLGHDDDNVRFETSQPPTSTIKYHRMQNRLRSPQPQRDSIHSVSCRNQIMLQLRQQSLPRISIRSCIDEYIWRVWFWCIACNDTLVIGWISLCIQLWQMHDVQRYYWQNRHDGHQRWVNQKATLWANVVVIIIVHYTRL